MLNHPSCTWESLSVLPRQLLFKLQWQIQVGGGLDTFSLHCTWYTCHKMVVKWRSPREALKCCSAVCVTLSSVAHWDKPGGVKINEWNHKRLAGLNSSSVKSMNSYNLMAWVPGIKTSVHVISWLTSIPKFPWMYPALLCCSGQLWGIEDRDADSFEEPFLRTTVCSMQSRGQLPHLWNLKIIQVETALTSLKTGVDNWYNFDIEVDKLLEIRMAF